MPKFINTDEAYRILQRELPEGVYPDGAPSAYFSTADSYATAHGVSGLYANMERIHENNYPQTADERIEDWIFKAFGFYLDSSLTLDQKRQKVIDKIRKMPSLALWEVLALCAQFLPAGTFVQIAEYGCGAAASWQLGVSLLGTQTFLAFNYNWLQLGVTPGEWCDFVANTGWRLGDRGLGFDTYLSEWTHLQVTEPQLDAFGYEIRIFGYTLSATERAQLDLEVKRTEPARSFHIFRDGLNLVDFGLVNVVNNVNQFSLIDCVAADAMQATGFVGRVA